LKKEENKSRLVSHYWL